MKNLAIERILVPIAGATLLLLSLSPAEGQVTWDHTYKGNALPQNSGWTRISMGSPQEQVLTNGRQTVLRAVTSGSTSLYYSWTSSFNPNTAGATVEARLRVNSVAPGAGCAQVFFFSTSNKLYGLQLKANALSWMDGASIPLPAGFDPLKFNIYRLVYASGTARLYLNNSMAPVSSNAGTAYGSPNRIIIGDTSTGAFYNGSVDWDFVRWTDNGAFTPEAVPKPFTPVTAATASGTTSVSMWGRTYRWAAGNPLPNQIVSQGKDVLYSPMEIRLTSNGSALTWTENSRTLIFKNERKATYTTRHTAGPFTLNLTITTEFDGLTRFTGSLSGSGQVDSLRIRIPVKANLATHYHAGYFRTGQTNFDILAFKANTMNAFATDFPGSKLPFAALFWLGGESAGLQWIAEWDKGWKNANPEQVLQLVQTASARELQVNVVDVPSTLTAAIPIDFAINVTPVKDTSYYWDLGYVNGVSDAVNMNFDQAVLSAQAANAAAHGATHTIIGGAGWPMHADIWLRAYENEAAFRTRFRSSVQTYQNSGIQVSYYGLWAYALLGEEAPDFGEDMINLPLYTAGSSMYWYNAEGIFPAFHLNGLISSIDLYGLDGMYLDTFVAPFSTDWALGQEWFDTSGKAHGKYTIYAMRNWLMKMQEIVRNTESGDGIIVTHNSGVPNLAIHTLSDISIGGEEFGNSASLASTMPLGSFFAKYSTRAFGIPFETIWYNWWDKILKENQILAVPLLHGQLRMRVGGDYFSWNINDSDYEIATQPHVNLHKMFRDFDIPSAQWWSYNLGSANWTTASSGLYTSSYVHPGDEAIVILGNMGTNDVTNAQITFDLADAGFTSSQVLRVTDGFNSSVVFSGSLSTAHPTITVDRVYSNRYRILRVRPAP